MSVNVIYQFIAGKISSNFQLGTWFRDIQSVVLSKKRAAARFSVACGCECINICMFTQLYLLCGCMSWQPSAICDCFKSCHSLNRNWPHTNCNLFGNYSLDWLLCGTPSECHFLFTRVPLRSALVGSISAAAAAQSAFPYHRLGIWSWICVWPYDVDTHPHTLTTRIFPKLAQIASFAFHMKTQFDTVKVAVEMWWRQLWLCSVYEIWILVVRMSLDVVERLRHYISTIAVLWHSWLFDRPV